MSFRCFPGLGMSKVGGLPSSTWATGKTSMVKRDVWPILLFSGVHYIVSQCILISYHAEPLAKWAREDFLHLHFTICSFFYSLPFSFAGLQLIIYGMACYCQRNCKSRLHRPFSSSNSPALNSVYWKKSGRALTATCFRYLQVFHWSASARPNHWHGPML